MTPAPAAVYQALLDPDAVAAWRVPAGMTSHVHALDPREGGAIRVSLTYNDAARAGKSDDHTDTYRDHFARLVLNELVVQVTEFGTSADRLRGTMTMITSQPALEKQLRQALNGAGQLRHRRAEVRSAVRGGTRLAEMTTSPGVLVTVCSAGSFRRSS
ncbi:SRPBCC domain-containing protein [Streptomyces sp. NPDC050564]|uniref:SRPBCC domain-containing protein n=1 Tax=Streptomyces sp. NPDC050564 TaxID=3365631 RepID=UPI003798D90B